ncbi:hypothetical protein MTO96_004116 [Rhipicephalus appendiculatus]
MSNPIASRAVNRVTVVRAAFRGHLAQSLPRERCAAEEPAVRRGGGHKAARNFSSRSRPSYGARVRVRSAGGIARRHCFDTMDATLVRRSEEATPARTEGATESEAVPLGEALMRTDRSTGSRCARYTLFTPSTTSFAGTVYTCFCGAAFLSEITAE